LILHYSQRHTYYAELLFELLVSSFPNYNGKNANAQWYSGDGNISKHIILIERPRAI
jgi:hypothetical protein